MATAQEPSVIPPELMAELQEAADNAAKGIRDVEAMDRACDEMDRAREELKQKYGEMNLAVELIREARE